MAGGSRRRGSATDGGAATSSRRRGGRRGGAAAQAATTSSASAVPSDREDSESATPPEEQWFQNDGGGGGIEVAAEAAPPPPPVPPPTAPPSQAFALTAAPMYPNSVKWSDENLIAVAAGHMVTILNPAALAGPRSFVAVSARPSFDFGTVTSDDLKANLLMPLTLSRDSRAVVRSIHWSPQGVASNGGCLLAVGTTDYRVKIYSPPLCEFRSEWVEVVDVSELMLAYCMKYDFLEHGGLSLDTDSTTAGPTPYRKRQAPEQLSPLEDKRRKTNGSVSTLMPEPGIGNIVHAGDGLWDTNQLRGLDKPLLNDVSPEDVMKILQQQKRAKKTPYLPQLQGSESVSPSSKRKKQTKFKDGTGSGILISSAQYMSRSAMLTPLALAWSPSVPSKSNGQSFVFIAAGTKAGMVGFWRSSIPQVYSVEKVAQLQDISFLGFLHAHDSWVTCVEWAKFHSVTSNDLVLATGCSDGSVKLWLGDSNNLMHLEPSAGFLPWTLLTQVTGHDDMPTTCLSLKVSFEENVLLAVGKASGCVAAWECSKSGLCISKATIPRAHEQTVMGVCWTKISNAFYSCGQDNSLRMWEFTENRLAQVESSLLSSEVPATAPDLPSSALESFFGLALSPVDLALAMVRGIAAEVVDPMYQSRSQKGVIQLIWVGGQDDLKASDTFEDDIVSLHSRAIYSITTSWRPRVTSALQYIEHQAQTIVLWDVLTVIAFLKSVCGMEILASIFQSWLPASKFVGTGVPDTCCWSIDDVKASLPGMSSRSLQIITAIFRGILLQDLKANLHSEGLEAMQNSVSRTQFTQEQQIWLDILWCMEYELRERLMFLALITAIKSSQDAQPLKDVENRISTALLMSDWILLNKSKVSPQLSQLADDVQKAYQRASSFQENCSFCDQIVPLNYLEVGYCRAEGMNTSLNHRLQRCSTSLRVCAPAASWYCSCCARNASQQAPELFFSLSSTPQIDTFPSISVLQQVVPRCPFCGILMQRIVPEFLLTPSLV